MLDISLNTSGKKVLCVGGGIAAFIKLRTLAQLNLPTQILSEKLCPDLHESLDMWPFCWIQKNWVLPQHNSIGTQLAEFGLKGGDIVLCCTDREDINQVLQEQCKPLGLLCYRADFPQRGDFQFQAGFEVDDLKVSVRHKASQRKESMRFRDYIQDLVRPLKWDQGQVFLCGFGPGDPDLMTIKARKLLLHADIVFYDDLIGPEVLNHIKCDKVYVGKRKGAHYKKQNEINDLLLNAAKNHLRVLRLKGGDPFIFGRGGEELLHLQDNGVKVSVVPGITASLAASASSMIPLTHRGISRRLTFMSAHHVDTELESIPKEGTLVLYMGASKLEFLSVKLQELGIAGETSVALIYNASQPDEDMEHLTIATLGKSNLKSPLAIIIGEVVNHFKEANHSRESDN